MSDNFSWKAIEKSELNQSYDLELALENIKYNEDDLVPAIAQQHDTGEILMMAWMNRESLALTAKEQRAVYWSRSRQAFWRKGESSGQEQHLKEFRLDCDADTILMKVDQTGPACHTGRRNCFYMVVDGDELKVDSDPLIDPSELYKK